MKNKSPHVMEVLWIAIAVICLIPWAHQTYTQGIKESYPFLLFSLVAIFMYLLRRQMRKNNQSK